MPNHNMIPTILSYNEILDPNMVVGHNVELGTVGVLLPWFDSALTFSVEKARDLAQEILKNADEVDGGLFSLN